MKENVVRNLLGSLILVSHFGLGAEVVWLFALGGFTYSEMTTAVALLLPLFAVHATAVVKYVIEHRNDPPSNVTPQTSKAYAVLAVCLIISYTSSLALAVWAKAHNEVFDSFDQFKTSLGLAEMFFAVLVGQVVVSLFGSHPKGRSRAKPVKID